MAADAHELLHGRAAAENGVIADAYMSREHDVIGKKNVVP